MYNYYADIVWIVDWTLLGILILTSIVIILCLIVKDYLWRRRRDNLQSLKKDVYGMVLSGQETSAAVCKPFLASVNPQQFIDIETNRNIGDAFFNDSEKEFFKGCFVGQEQIARFENIAKGSRNKWLKIEAMLCLGYLQTDHAVDILKDLLFSNDKDIAYFAIVSLGQIKTLQSAKALLGFLQKDPSKSYKIASVMNGFPKEIAEQLVKLSDYHDPIVRAWAVTLLSKFVSKDYFKMLEKLARDASAEVRAAACDCLGNIGSKEPQEVILKCLKDDSWLVRSHAILALEKAMKDAAVPHVIDFINDASWSVVDAVKHVMINHITASLPYIERFLFSDNEVAKKYSVYALQDSGYMTKLLNNAVSGPDKELSINLIKGILGSRVHFGLDFALKNLEPGARAKVLDIMAKI